MPLTDSYGQNIPFPTLTDKANARTLGEGIVENLTPRSVMRFPSASTRAATITAPVEGMVTWLADLNRLEVYDGSSWVAVAAGTAGWTNVPLRTADGWMTADSGAATNNQGRFQYRIVYLFGQPTIMFRGGIGRTSYPSTVPGSYVLTETPLPDAARPTNRRTVLVPCSDVSSDRISLKLDVNPDGTLELFGTGSTTKPPWVGFNGVFVSL